MSASLCIDIFSSSVTDKKELIFYRAESLTSEAEHQLLNKIQEILSVSKGMCSSFRITIKIEAADADELEFLIKRKINKTYDIISPKLSMREIEVLGLIMQGFTNNEIAEKLFICYETVKSHRKNILEKTGAKNTAALIHYYNQTFFEK